MTEYKFITTKYKMIFDHLESQIIKMYKKNKKIYGLEDIIGLFFETLNDEENFYANKIIENDGMEKEFEMFVINEFEKLYNYSSTVSTNKTEWFDEGGESWNAYKDYLSEEKGFKSDVINAIDTSTSNMLNSLTDPKTEYDICEKGLVIGDVQSGKTANYMGLIAKACDAKFDYIVVLAGVVENLRIQTQQRIENEIIGRSNGKNIGVSNYFIDEVNPNAMMITKTDSDFKRSMLRDFKGEDNSKTKIFVCKKNKSILESLKNQFNFDRNEIKGKSILIIDDESDQASVNTNKIDNDPTVINNLIRDLLHEFQKNYYIAYSATPAANLLIKKGETNSEGKNDLFPNDFIIRIEPGFGYTGYKDYFENEKILKIRDFENDETILEDAILDFIVSSATANILYEKDKLDVKQASMIVHKSHKQDEHEKLSEEVKDILKNKFSSQLYSLDNSEIKNRLLNIFNEKNIGVNYNLNFEDVFERILFNLDNNKTVIKVLNSSNDDELNYKNSDKNYIIVGGNKISRGLTIEGLLVTYFDRRSRLADTSLQMARWYGYRSSYINLTSLYTSEEVKYSFREIEHINQQIYNVIEELSASGLTPRDFTIELEKSNYIEITSINKRRNANKSIMDYSLESPQITKLDNSIFYPIKKIIESNFSDYNVSKEKSNLIIRNVDSAKINEFLRLYATQNSESGNDLSGSHKTNPLNWSKYIIMKNKIDELINWTVVIIGKQKSEITEEFFGHELHLIKRASKSDVENENIRNYKIISSPQDEKLDLNEKELGDMYLKDDRRKMRSYRSSKNGLLVIYPIYTEEGNDERYKGISLMLSLPDTKDKQDLDTDKLIN